MQPCVSKKFDVPFLPRWCKLLAGISWFTSSFYWFLLSYHNFYFENLPSVQRYFLQNRAFHGFFVCKMQPGIYVAFLNKGLALCWKEFRPCRGGRGGAHPMWKAPVFWGTMHLSLNLNQKIWPQSYPPMGRSLPLIPGAPFFFFFLFAFWTPKSSDRDDRAEKDTNICSALLGHELLLQLTWAPAMVNQ